MKKPDQIVFVFLGTDNTLEKVSHPIPMSSLKNPKIPKGFKLHKIILHGAKRCDQVLVSGIPTVGGKSQGVSVRRNVWFSTQTFVLDTPLEDEIFIVFEVPLSANKGKDIVGDKDSGKRIKRKFLSPSEVEQCFKYRIHLECEDKTLLVI